VKYFFYDNLTQRIVVLLLRDDYEALCEEFILQGLSDRCSITCEGVSLLGISDAADKSGFRTMMVSISFDKLKEETPLPCISH